MAYLYQGKLHNCIEPKIEKILKNQNGFRTNRSTTSQILTIRQTLECVCTKNLEAIMLFVNFSKAFDSRGKMEQILLTYGLPKETVAAIMMLYKNGSKSPLTEWRHRPLRHCSRCAARRHISLIPVYYLLRLHA